MGSAQVRLAPACRRIGRCTGDGTSRTLTALPTSMPPYTPVCCSSIMPCYKKQWEADRIDMQTPDGARSAPLCLLCLPAVHATLAHPVPLHTC